MSFTVYFGTLLIALVYSSIAAPLDNIDDAATKLELLQNHEEVVVDDTIDVEGLRKLDELIGQVELAAMSRVSLDVDDQLPEIEEKLRREEGVELYDEDGKLADIAQDLKLSSEEELGIIALPHKFRRYDSDGDGYVTPEELASATGTLLEDSMEPFEIADTNGDGLLTRQELHHAPWEFAVKRTRNPSE